MKKKILSLLLSLAISLSCLPIGIIASASESGATAQSGYNFKTQKKGIHFYSLGLPNNYDSDGDGTPSEADRIAELKALLEAGYFNEMFLGAPSAEVLALMRQYGITFWYMPGRWNPSGETLGGYLSRINTVVSNIKAAGAWDLFNGFHWDEPLGSGMTNEQINQMTEYLAKTHKKRIYPVISSYLVSEANREISEAAGKNEKELLSPIALEYVTDIGWDTYTYDVRDIALNDPIQTAKLQKYSQVSGKNITTADELYRDTHATIMSMIDHPVNVWFYVPAYNVGPYTKLGAGEDYCKAQLEYFDKLLDETTAQYENQLAGGLAIFTYQSDKFTGLSKRLPITVNGTQLYPEEPYADKWEDFAATMKSIKAKYDKTTDNVIYTGEKAPLDTGVDDSAYYLHKVPRITTSENTKYFHYTSDQQALSLRHDTDGNFYVINSSKLNTAGKYTEVKVLPRKGIDSTIDASKVKAIAVRMKINDNSPAYSYNPASFELMLNSPNGDGKESDDFWRANVSRTDTYTPMWLDLNDGSYTKMYPSSGNSSAAYFHTMGSMNGYMIIPIEAFANSGTRMTTSSERFTELLDAIRVTFIHTPDSESPKASNWNDKEFLFGDCYLVEDVDTFVAKRTEGTVKYNSGHDDGAYLAQKIPAYKIYYGGGINSTLYVPQIIAKASNDPTLAQNDESGYLHITKLADGSRAIEIKPNNNERAFVIARNYDTYEGKNQTGYYKDAIGGVPSSITSLGINGLASRMQITGNEGKTVNLALAVTSGTAEHEYCYYKTNVEGSKIKFISADNGEITEYTVRNNGIEIKGNINGYFVATDVSNASWSGLLSSSINNDVTGVGMVIYPGETNTDATIYLSDSYWLTDVDKFVTYHAIGISLDNVSVGKTSINIEKQDNAVYSLDGVTWDNGEGLFTGLKNLTTYTVYAKELSSGLIISKTFKTLSALDTERGDGSYFYYDFDTPAVGSTITYAQYSKVGSLRDSYATNGYLGPYKTGYYLYVENINGEGMLRLDHNEADTRIDENLMIYLSKQNESTPIDIKSYIDTDPLTHFAIRVKISGGTSGNVSAFNLSFFDNGITAADLSNIRLIDYTTRTVINPNWTRHFTFTDEFDGWIVVPFDAYATRTVTNSDTGESEVLTGKEQILGLATITPKAKYTVPSGLHLQFHLGCTSHGLAEGNGWDNRVLNFGDVVVLEDINKFINVNTVGVNLEDITVGKTSITIAQQKDAVYSLDGVSWDNGKGSFTGLNYNTTYTVYAKNTNIGTVISKEVTTLDVDITLDNATVTDSSIIFAAQDDAVYSLDGIVWDNGEGSFTGLKSNTTYTVYAKEISSGIIISKEFKTDVGVIVLDDITVGKTSITVNHQQNAVYSLDGISWDNGEGNFTALAHNTTYTVYAKNLDTQEVISKVVTTLDVDITLENAIITNQSIIFTAQDDAVYSLDGIVWDNGEGTFTALKGNTTYTVYAKELSSGIIISKDFTTDISIVTLDNVTVGKTTITVEKQHDAVYSLDSESWDNGEGTFTALTHNTEYTVYAKNLSTGEIISKTVKTLDVDITLNNVTVTNQSIIFDAQDDVVYSLNGQDWDNGEGTFTGLKVNTTYTVYAKEVSSGIVISKEIKTLSTFGDTAIETPEDYLCEVFGHNFIDATCSAPKTCIYCGATEGDTLDHTYEDECDAECNVCGFVRELTVLRVTSASITLESNIAINFKTDKAAIDNAGYTNPIATFDFCENSRVTVQGVDNGKGQYVFTFKNIAPDRLGDKVTARISAEKDGELVVSEIAKVYSVKEYCYSILNQYKDDDTQVILKTLLVDLLNYGAASQIYTSNDIANLVNKDLTEAEKALATKDTVINAAGAFIGQAGSVVWNSASLRLGDVVSLRFKFKAESVSGLTIKITTDSDRSWTIDKFSKSDDGCWYADFSGLDAHEMRTPIYLTIYDADDNAVSNTLKYSIETYATNKKDTTEITGLADMVVSMMKYGDSAAKYNDSL